MVHRDVRTFETVTERSIRFWTLSLLWDIEAGKGWKLKDANWHSATRGRPTKLLLKILLGRNQNLMWSVNNFMVGGGSNLRVRRLTAKRKLIFDEERTDELSTLKGFRQ